MLPSTRTSGKTFPTSKSKVNENYDVVEYFKCSALNIFYSHCVGEREILKKSLSGVIVHFFEFSFRTHSGENVFLSLYVSIHYLTILSHIVSFTPIAASVLGLDSV
jgi:hypothetical protein